MIDFYPISSALPFKNRQISIYKSVLLQFFPARSLNSVLDCERLFRKGAPHCTFKSLSHCMLKAFVHIQYNECFRVWEYVWSAHSLLIQLNRLHNIQQPAPTSNIVMQIACFGIFPDLDRKERHFPKVSSSRNQSLGFSFWTMTVCSQCFPFHYGLLLNRLSGGVGYIYKVYIYTIIAVLLLLVHDVL